MSTTPGRANGIFPNLREMTLKGEEHLTSIRELLALQAANMGEAVELLRANTTEEELHPLRGQALADVAGTSTIELHHRMGVAMELIAYSLEIQTPAATTLRLYRDSVEPPNLIWSDVVPASGIMSNRIPSNVVLPHNSRIIGVATGLTAGVSVAFLNVATRAVRVSGVPPYDAISP